MKKYKFETSDDAASSLGPVLELSDDARAQVLLGLLEVFHRNIGSWTTRAYQAVTWSVGLEFAAVGYTFIHSDLVDIEATVAIAVGLLFFSIMVQFYLRAAARGHYGNRLGIAKCEAALSLYESDKYLKAKPLFVYSPVMFRSRSLRVLSLFHAVSTLISILFVLLRGLWT